MSIEQRTDGSDWLDYAVTPEEHERRRKHFEAIALQQQGEAVAWQKGATMLFGNGAFIVRTGWYEGLPCVFVYEAEEAGAVGEKSPDLPEGEVPLLRLVFPTIEQARHVADSIVTHPPKPVVSDESDDKILWGIVANAGRLSSTRKARWAHVSDATGKGSTSSAELCGRFGFDPDAEVGGDNLDAFLAETEAELVVSDEVQELIVDAFMAGNQRGHESTVEGHWSDDRDIGHEYAVALGVKS